MDHEETIGNEETINNEETSGNEGAKAESTFTLKKWNSVAMWSWDVICDTCAICRVQVMGEDIQIFIIRQVKYCSGLQPP